ncbi:b(o/a)3-type cytochrome-c oxidase subunit 1 [Schinkia azotoformans]|uniref:b(o/a)3-type cytochrome-c oxidase subunit 1 n=1 Tax=Schinkia azotoformans TaxID=1454 RepID=UPI002DBD61D5|nr:b(o/a)3-type cytochrome-c oxidase subunit 1 [Schinkia azotoformans]MEC1722948.1 b(o/a)3-type cytochrome-c oxidase subunit 1 [Schinkia azotoformans]MED4414884.1 b(o/a)3-type cytochrome-c oxidase subunit 1 [Schinkia azotoformans]
MNPIASINPKDAKLTMAHFYVAFISLFLGATAGLLQVLVRSGKVTLPAGIQYYQVLTVHGVLLALVFTTFFIIGFIFATQSKTCGSYTDGERRWGWIGYWTMTIGVAIAATFILLGEASVLYTMYAPMMAHPMHYIGLTLVVVGSWICGFVVFHRHARWRKENRGQITPLLSYMGVMTMIMWLVACLGLATTVLVQIIPWSLGLVPTIDVLISRTLFWYFGHPLVYFWLLPAYMAWYVVVPKVIGGKIFSDALARLSFVLFILFSIPVGFHHQLLEPGIDPFWKYLQVVLTFLVVIPSLMTAFALFATFEMRGRELGATGLLGWWKKMPWKDARFFAPFMGMLFFAAGGAGGLVNASHQLNQVVHNTIWVTGHFHLTVGSAVAMTFFGVAFWIVPSITGRTLTPKVNKLGLIQTWLWTIGMLFMSGAMHTAGLYGAPRRSAFSTYAGNEDTLAWIPYQIAQAVGGTFLFLGALLMVYIFVYLAFYAPKGETEFPVGEVHDQAEKVPAVFENFKLWVAITFALVLFAYTIPFIDMIQNAPPGSPGYTNVIGRQ